MGSYNDVGVACAAPRLCAACGSRPESAPPSPPPSPRSPLTCCLSVVFVPVCLVLSLLSVLYPRLSEVVFSTFSVGFVSLSMATSRSAHVVADGGLPYYFVL